MGDLLSTRNYGQGGILTGDFTDVIFLLCEEKLSAIVIAQATARSMITDLVRLQNLALCRSGAERGNLALYWNVCHCERGRTDSLGRSIRKPMVR
jgi:hypothetical protein